VRWEYAHLLFGTSGNANDHLLFTHQDEHRVEGSIWDVIRELGDDGWELVTTHVLKDGEELWFKRPLQEDAR
jgi:hypothetical protein